MKDTLLEVFQQRMDKCQSEQAWAVTAYAAANAFVISEKSTFTTNLSSSSIVFALGAIGFATLIFVLIRKHEYYLYRRDMARLLAKVDDAPAYMKEEKRPRHVNLWVNSGSGKCPRV